MRKKNRNSKQDRQGKRDTKVNEGTRQIVEEQRTNREEYKLDWFKPTETQQDIIYSMIEDDLTLVQGSSGSGKSTTVIWQALKDLKGGVYRKIVFVKSATESSDDGIGFLPSTAEDKLAPHFEATKGIFHQFMSINKLEMEIKNGRIDLKIPNFLQGASLDNCLVILDESQNFSPNTLKLSMERIGKGSKLVVLGDKNQQYALKKRPNGFTDFVNKVTDTDEEGRYSKIPTIGYIEMTAKDNMRSDLSKLVVSIYEEEGE